MTIPVGVFLAFCCWQFGLGFSLGWFFHRSTMTERPPKGKVLRIIRTGRKIRVIRREAKDSEKKDEGKKDQ